MSNVSVADHVKYTKLVKTDVDTNENKWWDCKILPDFSVVVEFGRNGYPCVKPSVKAFGSQAEAESFFNRKVAEKMKGGYKPFRGVNGGGTQLVGGVAKTSTVNNVNLIEAARREIDTNSPETVELVEYLLRRNAHQIVSKTNLTYDESAGTFRTVHGVIDAAAIREARGHLDTIASYMTQNDGTASFNARAKRALNEYLMLVPRDFGRGRTTIEQLFPSQSSIQQENGILDQLQGSWDAVTNSKSEKPVDSDSRTFEAKLHIVRDGDVVRDISNFYESTLNRMHTTYRLKIAKLYSVEIANMKRAYENCRVSNPLRVFHGTKDANVASILASGFKIPPANSSYVTGRMFGPGIYTSDQASKATQYAYGYAPGQSRGGVGNRFFVFVCEVRLGNPYIPRSSTGSNFTPPMGYDSCFAKGGISGVSNNEIIVYKTEQVNPTYLIELTD